MGEAPDEREREDCPGSEACDGKCDQHEQAMTERPRMSPATPRDPARSHDDTTKGTTMSYQPITIQASGNINQTARARLSELIRAGAIKYKRENDPTWREKPWMDGIAVDLDEDDVLDAIVDYVVAQVTA